MQHHNQESQLFARLASAFTFTRDASASLRAQYRVLLSSAGRMAITLSAVALIALAFISGAAAKNKDVKPPTAPTNVRVVSASTKSVGLAWSGSRDNVGVSGYRVSVNGTYNGTTKSTSYTVGTRTCGRSYTFSVVAYDAAVNRSK